MSIAKCPHCYNRYTYEEHAGDYNHQCNSGKPVLDQEDILVFSNRAEEFGTTVNTGRTPSEIVLQGQANKLQGTTAGILGASFGGVTVRGNPKQTMRQRQHFEYIENPKVTKPL